MLQLERGTVEHIKEINFILKYKNKNIIRKQEMTVNVKDEVRTQFFYLPSSLPSLQYRYVHPHSFDLRDSDEKYALLRSCYYSSLHFCDKFI